MGVAANGLSYPPIAPGLESDANVIPSRNTFVGVTYLPLMEK
jgi:hypothetical protein